MFNKSVNPPLSLILLSMEGKFDCMLHIFFCIAGGFAKVKLAYHALTGDKVAIKIMDKKSLGVSNDIALYTNSCLGC